jgi:hypothetical protein
MLFENCLDMFERLVKGIVCRVANQAIDICASEKIGESA